MPHMSTDGFSVHDDDCPDRESDWMPISDLPDEVTSADDLECACWDEYNSLTEI